MKNVTDLKPCCRCNKCTCRNNNKKNDGNSNHSSDDCPFAACFGSSWRILTISYIQNQTYNGPQEGHDIQTCVGLFVNLCFSG